MKMLLKWKQINKPWNGAYAMCEFFSCVSDGKGNVRHFSIGDVAEIMAKGNPKDYDFNSHTSFLHFLGEKGPAEDKLNKWEYDPATKALKLDTLSADNDEPDVRDYLNKFFASNNAEYVRNLFDRNTGHRNTGDRNTGHGNTTDYASGCFNTIATRTMFNEICTQSEINAVSTIDLWSWYDMDSWVYSADMTATEKNRHPSHVTTGGFIRQIAPKLAWKKCPDAVLEQIMALPHFNAKVFKDISGIDVRKKKKTA